MRINSQLFEAFVKCPTKCFLLSRGEMAAANPYADWVCIQDESFHREGVKRWTARTTDENCTFTPQTADDLKAGKWRLATNVVASADQVESTTHTLEQVQSQCRGQPAQVIPTRFCSTSKVTHDDKLRLGFDAFVVSEMLGCDVVVGKIVHGKEHATTTVKTSVLANEVRTIVGKITELLASNSPPDLVLNRHCAECGFYSRCRQKAIEKDDLSLLSGMKETERKNLNTKGIFTVTQLSYTFRPRRRPRELAGKRERYHHSLKALAIRERKIHIAGSPELKIHGTPVYLDVEGIPDLDFYYLIGIRVKTAQGVVQHSLWADNREAEKTIWRDFLKILSAIENPVLLHYGKFETTFLKRMRDRYGDLSDSSKSAEVLASSVNVLSVIYAQVYFPTFSNGLKDVAGQLGFRWSDSTASGLQTIVWRDKWATTRCATAKQALVTYNSDDCEALELVANTLLKLQAASPGADHSSRDDVVHAATIKRGYPYGFKCNAFVFPELDAINKAAYWDYQRERVYVKSNTALKRASIQSGTIRRTAFSPNKKIECPRPRSCPKCRSTSFVGHGAARKTVLDVRFMARGIKRWITLYKFHRYKCRQCGGTFYPEEIASMRSKYGADLVAFSLYQNIELRLPQQTVDRSLNRLFGFHPVPGRTNHFKQKAAIWYEDTYVSVLTRLCRGQLIHADETKVSVGGKDGVVWVFANLEEVAYVYSQTREGDILRTLFKEFTGVLVSDFYAAYDGIPCPQQKCLIHLIRDLNEAVLKHPYDEELKSLVKGFAGLVKPMVETIDRHGLKSRFLRKHLVLVDRFYRQLSGAEFRREPATKCKERFEKNRDKLFTFLTHDGVPWNNNNAEYAVKAFAMLRRVIDGVTSEKGIREYLVLLSICQTCKYRNLDFLDFLRSGERDIEGYALSKRGRRTMGAS